MQTAKITLRILHRPDVEFLPHIWQQYGVDYDDRILPSIGNEILKVIFIFYFLLFSNSKIKTIRQLLLNLMLQN